MIKKFFKLPITNYPQKIGDFRGLNPRNFSEIPEGQLLITNKGLTLLEMAISMAILAIALVALANLFPIGLKLSRRASTFSEASILAQRVLENIKTAASVYDEDIPFVYLGDKGKDTGNPFDISNMDGIGYFELANQDQAAFPFGDNDLFYDLVTGTRYIGKDVHGYSTYCFKYYEDKTNNRIMDMTAYVKSVDWDANGNGTIGREDLLNPDWDDVLLSQKVYVAIYWTEADRSRADTFITYISNPFYEKYK